ncbi:MAG TPA: type II and III secretion system protein family protein [Pseudolabrys sp.]|nr:type II and III secretion system protein family protein [Pseudolabrys sp.]
MLAAAVSLSFPAAAADVHANSPVIRVAASDAASRFIPLGIGKSVAIDLPADIKDVLVADPKVANAVIRSARRVYMIGVSVGQTNIFFFDAQGRQIAGFDIAVTRDLNGLRGAIRRMLPNAHIQVEGIGKDAVMLSGTAQSPGDAQQAYDIAARLVGSNTKVINSITVKGRDQVMIKVTVAEVQRNVVKQLGIDVNGTLNYGTAVVNFNTDNPFSASGAPLTNTSLAGAFRNVNVTLRAMERAGVIRTLAQPTLTAISGETANFLVGGEFPYPVPNASPNSPPSIEFKKFGVSLMFTPVVLSEGRISLKVLTEVSQLSNDNSVTVQGTTVPALTVRRAETTVEIPSGGSLALAGMIQEQTRHAINGIPGLLQVPILGTLFRSRDYVNDKTELMILVTPYIVRPVSEKKLARPDDGFEDPSDPASAFLGRLNRIYGASDHIEAAPVGAPGYHGTFGFILD